VELLADMLRLQQIKAEIAGAAAALDAEIGLPLESASGRFDVVASGPNLRAVVPKRPRWTLPEAPFDIRAKGKLADGLWSFDALSAQLGEARLTGSGVFDQPRRILRAIRGLDFVEMARIREYAFCCGGGGGVPQAHPELARKTALHRLEEAADVGAECLVTACHHCRANLTRAQGFESGALPVVDIIDLSSLYVSAPMDEVDSAAIHAGQHAKLTVDSYPDTQFEGTVVRVAPYVLDFVAQNRTVEIEVELVDAAVASKLLPGTSADVEVVLEARSGALRLPTSALLENSRVLVANDGRLEERPVEIGLKNWDYAEVTGGLDEGQRVVISLDRVEVKTGARVEVEETEYRP